MNEQPLPEDNKQKLPRISLEFVAAVCIVLLLVSSIIFYEKAKNNPDNLGVFGTIKQFFVGDSFKKEYINQTKIELESAK